MDDRRSGRLRRLPAPPGPGPHLAPQDPAPGAAGRHFVELEYRSALVPIFGADIDASALRSAAKLVGEGALVEAVYVLRVPNQLSLDAGLEEEEQRGLSVLESAKVTGRKAGLKVQTRLLRTRNPGAAIVEEAERTKAEIIYLATAHAPAVGACAGADGQLPARPPPCRVVIETPAVINGNARSALRRQRRRARGRRSQHGSIG